MMRIWNHTQRAAGRLAFIAGTCVVLVAASAQQQSGSPVADAAQRGDIITVRKLIAEKANVSAPQGDGMTALHWAAQRGDAVMATALLKAKADVRATTRIGSYTALHLASRSGNGAIVAAILAAGADANAATASGATSLHFASAAGSIEGVNALLDHKANVNAKESEWGQTALVFAADADRGEVIRVLLKRGADPSIRTKSIVLTEEQAREQAATRKRNEVMVSFLPKDSTKPPAPANAGGADGGPPPANAAAGAAGGRGGAAGGDGGRGGRGGGGPAPQPEKLTPSQIQQAIEEGRKALAAAPAGPAREEADTADGQVAGFAGSVGQIGGFTPLHHAVREGNLSAVIALLDGGANINDQTPGDSTSPLLLSTINGQFDVSMELIKRGANVNLASTAGATPLYTAINTQWAPKSRFPQPQAVQNQKATYLEVMQALIDKGANVNARLKSNLWYFAFNNCGNANCGLESIDGTTPFWRATYSVDLDAMKLLQKHGADVTLPSQRSAAAGGRGGGRGGRGAAGRAGAAADSAGAGGQVAANQGRGGGGGGGGGGAAGGRGGRGGDAPPAIPLDPAIDSAAKAVPPGIGVYPVHAAAGVGYGNGFAGNSHRHAPNGWMPAMKYLVEELKADVNARDNNGYTPLHHAAARGDNEMILYLVSKGADPKAVARNGRTTVDMANGPVQRMRPFPETIALLEKMGAKNSHKCISCSP